jgi:hypothetical protein
LLIYLILKGNNQCALKHSTVEKHLLNTSAVQ